MNSFSRHIALFAFAMLFSVAAWAVPAKPTAYVVRQPDGTMLTLHSVGDEFFHTLVTDDGLMVTQADDGSYVYTTSTAPTGIMAHDSGSRSATERQFVDSRASSLAYAAQNEPSEAQLRRERAQVIRRASQVPNNGTARVPVLLVQYSDVAFRDTTDAINTFRDFFMQGETSAHQYFTDQSQGKYDPQFDVYGPVTLGTRATYGANKTNGYDVGVGIMVAEACLALQDSIDYSLYDNNGDNECDVIIVLYAGVGEASASNVRDAVWPCQWQLTSSEYGQALNLSGVRINKFAVFNELNGAHRDQIDGVGTFCHEFGHCLGLPDFYDVAYSGKYFGMGHWSIMDRGCYDNDGYSPCGYTAYEKNFMGWMDLIEPTPNTPYQLDAIDLPTATALKIVNSQNSNEYYILENRQKTGWNSYQRSHGMMVTHVTYNATRWNNNSVNRYAPQGMTIIPADGQLLMNSYRPNEANEAGDLYPYNGNNSLTDTSTPPAAVNTGSLMHKPVTHITETDGKISLIYMFDDFERAAPVLLPADTALVNHDSFTAQWAMPVSKQWVKDYTLEVTAVEENPEGAPRLAAVESGDETTRTITFVADTAYVVGNLLADTQYSYKVRATFVDGAESDWSEPQTVIMLDRPRPTLATDLDSLKFATTYAGDHAQLPIEVVYGELRDDVTLTIEDDEHGVFSASPDRFEKDSASDYVFSTVTFSPDTAGTFTAVLRLATPMAKDVLVPLIGTGIVPEVIALPDTISFPTTIINTVATAQIDVLAADLKGDVTLTLVDENGAFSLDTEVIPKAEAEEGAQATITFNPIAEGEYRSTIFVEALDAEPYEVALVGIAVKPVLVAVPADTLRFKTTNINLTDTAQVAITGTYLKDCVTLTIEDDVNGAFTLATDTLTLDDLTQGVAAEVRFTPTVDGQHKAVLAIASTDADTLRIILAADAVRPALFFDTDSLIFENILMLESGLLTVTLTGEYLKDAVNLAITGDGSEAFSIDTDTLSATEATEGATITIVFAPAEARTYEAFLTAVTVDAEPCEVALVGYAQPWPDARLLAPAADTLIDFGNVGTHLPPPQIKLHVQGYYLRNDLSLKITGENAGRFDLTPTYITAADANTAEGVDVTITYSPYTQWEDEAFVLIESPDFAEPRIITLWGTGELSTGVTDLRLGNGLKLDGNTLHATVGTRVFNITGTEVLPKTNNIWHLPQGIYIITTATGKTQKIVVR